MAGMSEVADLYLLLRAFADPSGFATFAAEGEAAAGRVSGGMAKILPVSAAVTGAALLGAGMSVKWATDFQTAYTKLYTAAGASKDQVLANTDAMLKLGNQTGFTGTQIADAMYHPISAGLDFAKALEVAKTKAKLSGEPAIVTFPRKKSLWERLSETRGVVEASRVKVDLTPPFDRAMAESRNWAHLKDGQPMMMLPYRVRIR